MKKILIMKRLLLTTVTILVYVIMILGTVFSLYVRSTRKHFNELLVVLSSAYIKFDIIMLSETRLDNNIGDSDIKRYNCYNHYSSLKYISDGISVYIKDSIIVNDVITGGINH